MKHILIIKNHLNYYIGISGQCGIKALKWVFQKLFNRWIIGGVFILLAVFFSLYISYCSNFEPLKSNAIDIFIVIASIYGGILAIVFPIITLLMQNAAKATSTGFYHILAESWRIKLYFITLAVLTGFSLLLAGIASGNEYSLLNIVFNNQNESFITLNSNHIFFGLLLSIIVVFGGLAHLSSHIYERIDPNKNVDFIFKRIQREISRKNRLAVKDIRIFLKALPIQKKVFFNNSSEIRKVNKEIKRAIEYLFDYYDKLVSNKEKHSAKVVLSKIKEILIYDFNEVHKNVYLKSDPVAFYKETFRYTFEELLHRGDQYLKVNDTSLILSVVNVFVELMAAGSKYKVPLITNFFKSPLLTEGLSYFKMFANKCIASNNTEGLFQVIIGYEKMSQKFIQDDDLESLHSLLNFEEMLSIGENAIITKDHFIYGQIIDSYKRILTKLVSRADNQNFDINLIPLLRRIKEVILISKKAPTTDPNYSDLFDQKAGDFFYGLTWVISGLIELINQTKDDSKKHEKIAFLIGFIETVHKELIKEVAVFAPLNSHLGRSITKYIESITWTLFEAYKVTNANEHTIYLIQQHVELAEWLIKEPFGENIFLEELIDIISKTGLHATLIKENNLAEFCIDTICRISILLLEKCKVGFGLTEPRVFVKSLYIGLLYYKLNPKKSSDKLIKKLKADLKKFNEVFQKKYFSKIVSASLSSPSINQVMVELNDLKNEYEYEPAKAYNWLTCKAKTVLFEKIDKESDIDSFIKKI